MSARKLQLTHLAATTPDPRLWLPEFTRRLSGLGELRICPDTAAWTEGEVLDALRHADVVLTGWNSRALPVALAGARGRLRYICHLTGTMRAIIPRELVAAGIPVTNWGDAPADGVAEAALALLLGCLKVLPAHGATRRAGGWHPPELAQSGTLRGLRIGLYGYGVVGRRFHALLRPFQPVVSVYDPLAAALPDDARPVGSLLALFAGSDAVALHAALTPETRGSVRAEHLAALRDHGILINTARGDLLDQTALFAELERGRLRAGLDVLAKPEMLAADHPARHWTNLILTGHKLWTENWPDPGRLGPLHVTALDNLARFARGEDLRFRIDERRYDLST